MGKLKQICNRCGQPHDNDGRICQWCEDDLEIKKTRITPGPWKVDNMGVVTGGKDFRTIICECYLPPRLEIRPDSKELVRIIEEQQANAKLIGSAILLVVALEKCIEFAAACCPSRDDKAKTKWRLANITETARAALKAAGIGE